MSGSPSSIFSSASICLFGACDRGVLRQGQVDQQLGPVGGREELVLHEAHADERRARTAPSVAIDGEPCGAAHGEQQRRKRGLSRAGLGRARALAACRGSMVTPSSGVNSTATTQETISAMRDHGEQRKAVLAGRALAKPIGTKPATVTSVPVSIGKGGRAVGEGGGLDLRSPPRACATIISTEIMASSTSRPSAMISAPSEMRCR